MKLGIVEYMIKGPDDLATFRTAQRLGLDGVEVQLFRHELLSDQAERLHRLQEARADTGVEVCSLALPNHSWECGLGMADPALVQQAIDEVRHCIDWAATLGAGAILIPFFGATEILSADDMARAAAGLRAVCPHALERRVMLCVETTLAAPELKVLAEAVNSTAFGCYFDIANMIWLGLDPATELRRLGPLVGRVHVKDTRITPSDCTIGLGRVDWASTTQALQEIHYDGWVVGEYSVFRDGARATPRPPRQPEAVARDLSFTRSHLPGLSSTQPWPRLGCRTKWFGYADLPRMITHFAGCGLSAVQIIGAMLDEAAQDPSTAVAIRQQLQAHGFLIGGLGPYRSLVVRDATLRRANIEFVKRCLELAPLFGTGVVATETGTRHPDGGGTASPENRGKEAWGVLCEALDELVPVAEQHHCVLALEGHVRHVLQNASQMLALLDRYQADALQFVLDPYNYTSSALLPACGRVVSDWLNRFEHRFVLAHLKDVSPEGAEVGTPEFGTGVFPNDIYLDFLRTRRPDLPIILDDLKPERVADVAKRVWTTLSTDGN